VAESTSESDWVRAARGGDRRAYSRLVDAYWDRIRRWLFALVRQAQMAEDLTQEVFLKSWVGLPELKEDHYFRAWLFRIARNLAHDQRKRRSEKTIATNADELPGREAGPLAELLSREEEQAFQAACARLPSTYREAYLLWASERMPFGEVARALGISEVNARWRVCMARRFLVHELKLFLEEKR
jgi:RNA polymerase sigma factor (sigma-70 family)